MTDKIVVLSACATEADGERIARHLVESRLAACVSLIPGARSFYWWKGAVENSPEVLLIIKSSRGLFDALRVELEKAHSYEIPELLALSVVEGSAGYLSWLERELKTA
jgi:periplasmic divalent cation tolerance protein